MEPVGTGTVRLLDLCAAGPLPVDAAATYVARELLRLLALDDERAIEGCRVGIPRDVVIEPGGTVRFASLASGDSDAMHGYRSPELWLGTDRDQRSDLFAVGVVLYELLAGRKPFGETRQEILGRIFDPRPPEPVCNLRIDVDAQLSQVVERLLACERSARYQSADEALAALPACPHGRERLVAVLAGPQSVASRELPRASPAPAACMVASVLMDDRYKIGGRIGKGGMGCVYRGWRRLANGEWQQVAFKRIAEDEIHKPGAVERFDREALLCIKKLDHDSVVKVFDYIEKDGQRWIVMEEIDGITLEELAERERLPFGVHRAIFCSVLDALYYIHGCGLLHQDISPSNIMVTRDGSVKLMDFGVAREYPGSPDSRPSGSVHGTAPFAPLEALVGKDRDPSSDLYSLAAVMFYLMTGRPPYGKGTHAEVRRRHLQGDMSPWPIMPTDFRVVLEPMLRPRSERLFQTAGQVMATLHACWQDNPDLLLRNGQLAEYVQGVMPTEEMAGESKPGEPGTEPRREQRTTERTRAGEVSRLALRCGSSRDLGVDIGRASAARLGARNPTK